MKKSRRPAAILLCVIVILYVIIESTIGSGSVDIQFHDTYYVVGKREVFLLLLIPVVAIGLLMTLLTRKA